MLTIPLSGPLVIASDGTPVTGLSRRAQGMLAFLAAQPGLRADRSRLADLLWSDRGPEQARASLRQELSVMRKALPDGVLDADRQWVWMDSDRVAVTRGPGVPLDGFDLASEGFEDWLREQRSAAADIPAPKAPLRPAQRNTAPALAVMPFDDLNAAAGDMFADGVVEEITGALSRVQAFDVIARQSAFALRGQALDVPTVADRLGADYVVEGSVRRAGDRVRIAVQLVRGSDGFAVWSERFDDRLDDLFALQDRIAAQVAGQMSPSLRQVEITRARTAPPADRSAYDLTLTALPHFWAHRKDENARAIDLLDAALARDPDYTPALAYKAWALGQQPSYMWSSDPDRDHRLAVRTIDRALQVVGDHAPSLVAISAALTLSSTRVELATHLLDRALAIDPNNAWGLMRRGWTDTYAGRSREALDAFDRAEALSPLDPFLFNIHFGRSVAARMLGDYDEALRLIHVGMHENPGCTWVYRVLAGTYTLMGDKAAADDALHKLMQHYPHLTVSYLMACIPPSARDFQPDYVAALQRMGLPD